MKCSDLESEIQWFGGKTTVGLVSVCKKRGNRRKAQICFSVSLCFKPTEQSATIATAEERCTAPPAFAVDVTLGNGQSEVDISLYNRSKGIELWRRSFLLSGSQPLVLGAVVQPRTLRWLVRGVYFQYYKHVLCFPAPTSTACWRRPYCGVRKRGGPCNSLLVWIRQYKTPTFCLFYWKWL